MGECALIMMMGQSKQSLSNTYMYMEAPLTPLNGDLPVTRRLSMYMYS